MNKQIDDLLYHAGLTAQGCWDELGTYEQEAIEKLVELVVKECAKTAYLYASDNENYKHYDDLGWDCLPGDLQSHIKEHFGVEE